MRRKILSVLLIALFALTVFTACKVEQPTTSNDKIKRFKSDGELINAFQAAREGGFLENMLDAVAGGGLRTFGATSGKMEMMADTSAVPESSGRDFSDTNIQVQGVDEADIIKTDGDYIYTLSNNQLVIIKAYPADEAEEISTIELKDFYPNELFIHGNRLLVFGRTSYRYQGDNPEVGMPVAEKMVMPDYYRRYYNFMSVKLFDISDKEDPDLLRNLDFEGNYITSRKIDDDVYFVMNNYPQRWDVLPTCGDIVPRYRDTKEDVEMDIESLRPFVDCTDIGYIEPIQAEQFITIASLSMTNEDKDVEKEVIVGSGQNVYASRNALYVAQTTWPRYTNVGELVKESVQKTVITKFNLDNGKIAFDGKGEVKGHILNQFSMDEYDNHFRIATTSGNMWGSGNPSMNNVYVLDKDMETVGELEDLAPGEKIYSVRFMGKKGYIVTFKKVDPLFVIDLEDHENPKVLGKLKIPGYSDYLHPYDETHIIGIGKDTVEADEGLVEGRGLDFAWYQGVKMAIFDVSDVEHPIEMHKVIIGDRGTDSEALHNHKAFLFDREKNLLVIPITLAEIPEEQKKADQSVRPQYGDFTFQGAYVYNIDLEDGFDLRGKVTHYDDDEVFKKSGYYFRGNSAIRRSLYIEDILYTLSSTRLQLNDLDTLERLNKIEFEGSDDYPDVIY